jgi:hypothetical protein
MKAKVKKCFKWTLFILFIFVVLGSILGRLGGHRRFQRGGGQGPWAGMPIPQANLHHHFQHGNFHVIGFILAILLWGIIISVVLKFIRRRKANCRTARAIREASLVNGLHQSASPNAEILDQWERNLKHSKEDVKNGDL